jgi:hypothetical protein
MKDFNEFDEDMLLEIQQSRQERDYALINAIGKKEERIIDEISFEEI